MLDYTVRDKSKKIVTAGKQLIFGIVSAILSGVSTDMAGTKLEVGFSSLNAPGLGQNILSSSDAAARGIKTGIEEGNSRLERNDIILPVEHRKVGMKLFSFQVELAARGSAHKTPTLAMAFSSQTPAGLWNRRFGHMKAQSMELLRKMDDNGVDFTGTL